MGEWKWNQWKQLRWRHKRDEEANDWQVAAAAAAMTTTLVIDRELAAAPAARLSISASSRGRRWVARARIQPTLNSIGASHVINAPEIGAAAERESTGGECEKMRQFDFGQKSICSSADQTQEAGWGDFVYLLVWRLSLSLSLSLPLALRALSHAHARARASCIMMRPKWVVVVAAVRRFWTMCLFSALVSRQNSGRRL